uniref:Uncharacterized protein n=1 Tax=uncultured marine virus TaxID=186617 RepID=A0A0F7L5L5_9VIRU|nr:hypothetical protein [uncultured marine virus]
MTVSALVFPHLGFWHVWLSLARTTSENTVSTLSRLLFKDVTPSSTTTADV